MNILNATSIVENNEVEFPKNDGLKQLKDSHYSVIAAYDSLVLDKNDMKKIYSELKKVKANINRTNMDTIKSILISKLNLELPTSRKYQLEHLVLPYTKDQIPSSQKNDQMKRNLILLQYYVDILCYGFSIYLTKWQCSSWFNIFKTTHEKFIDYVSKHKDPSTYKSQCINIFKDELFYFCNSRTVTLYLKEDECNKNTEERVEETNADIDNLEEYLLSNRYVKPGIFDSILPTPVTTPLESRKNSINSLNASHRSINDQTLTPSEKLLNLVNDVRNNKENLKNQHNSHNGSKSHLNSNNKLYENEKIIDTINHEDDDNEENHEKMDENEQDKDYFIIQYNIPKTFNPLQIESLTRFFFKTYIQHINIIAYVFSQPQNYICHNYKKAIVSPDTYEELENGILAEEWPNWVQEQENIIIKKKEEEEAAIEMERKKKEEVLLKEKEKLEKELANQKLKETQDNIKNSLISMLYQPLNKNISELPAIPKIKPYEKTDEQTKEDNINANLNNNNNNNNEKPSINIENEENKLIENLNEENININAIKFKITNPNFKESFLELWKRKDIEKEQNRKDLLYHLQNELQRKNDSYIFDLSEQSLVKLEKSRQELINKIKEISTEEENNKIRHVYDPEQVDASIQNSELLKDQYFTQLQKHVEEIISSNIQHISERLAAVNLELEKLKGNDTAASTNKKGANINDASKKKDNKSMQKPKKK
ncbi:hypothetical protein H8356DRAFT_1692588 [Neocallimastix lanati (nom. inval.)]|uniref:Uncharacterized protein n=1 Tax=Neocallimastix californiae TaxID=1754190 RepID=A0A1Y2EU15_9FUNG|nr:hypothetical protein H8356DRAFT_1692588 [Neocallimastix sp. JGI-2020a]ORY74666.1 hypothetical protein LY90DRAFT_666141 [Neocallimastix californiae]|eukprot:ORY74666.1 hypothetical protein LY90DRAFT_666141 [Neocallimastix californiae]